MPKEILENEELYANLCELAMCHDYALSMARRAKNDGNSSENDYWRGVAAGLELTAKTFDIDFAELNI